MKTTELTISNTIKQSWRITIDNYAILISSIGVLFAISLGFAIIQNIIAGMQSKGVAGVAVMVLGLASLVEVVLRLGVQNLTSIGFTQLQLNVLDKKPTKVGMLFQPEGLFWRYLGGSIVYGLIVLGGLILLIVPGIVWGLKYQFALPLIVDKKITVKEAIAKSGDITRGKKSWLLGFIIILGLINVVGFLALGFGLLLTIPLTSIAHMWVYRQLLQSKK